MNSSTLIISTVCVALLSACAVPLLKDPFIAEELDELAQKSLERSKNKAKKEALVQEFLQPAESAEDAVLSKYTSNTFDVMAREMPVKDFFLSLVQGTGENIILDPSLAGFITIELKSVNLEQTLTALNDVYGFQFTKKPYGYQISPQAITTRIYNLDYLNVERVGSSETSVSSGELAETLNGGAGGASGAATVSNQAGEGKSSRVVTRTDTNFWSELELILNNLLGEKPDRQVVVNPHTGIVIARGLPAELSSIEEFIDRAEASLNRQVILEAKVLEITLNDRFETGVRWESIGQFDNPDKSTIGGITEISGVNGGAIADDVFGRVFSLGREYRDFTGLIEMLQQQGNVQVLSSPRISTVNNQKAVIKVGTDEFFVTEVSAVVGNGDNSDVAPDLTLTPFFSGIALDVTPQINDNDEIILHVHPTVSEVVDQSKTINIGNQNYTFPLALSSIRESDSIVRAESNQIIVIGGLLKSDTENVEATVPYLSRIPIIGALFTQKRDAARKTELVILLKPTVVGGESWDRLLKEYRDSSDKYRHIQSESFY